jgi:hypothetical protein
MNIDAFVSSHVVKCIGEWTGKGNLHTYSHAFVVETLQSKLFHCSADSEDTKRMWLGAISLHDQLTSPVPHDKPPAPASPDSHVVVSPIPTPLTTPTHMALESAKAPIVDPETRGTFYFFCVIYYTHAIPESAFRRHIDMSSCRNHDSSYCRATNL